ncbi:hypothetical protein [Caldicellulosiruptor acetigenus]|nr:hypothetical protein [Caldicellulosiruptor acetigenus]
MKLFVSIEKFKEIARYFEKIKGILRERYKDEEIMSIINSIQEWQENV